MHPPKAARYDLGAKTHTTERGVFAVDRCERGDGWLYLARPFVRHPHIAYAEAYLLPELGLQVNRWEHHPESTHGWYDFYLDIMAFEVRDDLWTSRDFYLDIVVIEGRGAHILDTDEFLAAQAEGLLTPAEACYTLTAAHALLNGLAEHGYSVGAWLETRGMALTWHR